MSASDSFVGEALAPSPYAEAVAEKEVLSERYRELAMKYAALWRVVREATFWRIE